MDSFRCVLDIIKSSVSHVHVIHFEVMDIDIHIIFHISYYICSEHTYIYIYATYKYISNIIYHYTNRVFTFTHHALKTHKRICTHRIDKNRIFLQHRIFVSTSFIFAAQVSWLSCSGSSLHQLRWWSTLKAMANQVDHLEGEWTWNSSHLADIDMMIWEVQHK